MWVPFVAEPPEHRACRVGGFEQWQRFPASALARVPGARAGVAEAALGVHRLRRARAPAARAQGKAPDPSIGGLSALWDKLKPS